MSDPRNLPTLSINVHWRCPHCRKLGAIVRDDNTPGPCLKCATKIILGELRKGQQGK